MEQARPHDAEVPSDPPGPMTGPRGDDGSRASATAELVRRLMAVIPPTAVARPGPWGPIVGWRAAAPGYDIDSIHVAFHGPGAVPGYHEVLSIGPWDWLVDEGPIPDDRDERLSRMAFGSRALSGLLLARPHGMEGPHGPALVAAIRAMADHEPTATLAMARAHLASHDALAWMADPAMAPMAAAFAHAHPWLAHEAHQNPCLRHYLAAHPPSMAARLILVDLCGLDAMGADRVRDAMAPLEPGSWKDGTRNLLSDPAHARAMASMPMGMLPGEGGRAHGQAEARGVLQVAAVLAALARMSGRDMGSVAGRFEGWREHAERIAGRAGSGNVRVAFLSIADAATAFAEQVVAPAMMATGWPERLASPPGERVWLGWLGRHPATAGAVRILLGSRTLPALAELAAAWHARKGAADRLLSSLAAPDWPDGPLTFPDTDLGDGTYATCLHRAADLADEGADGPDAAGAMGLSHCVGGYASAVVRGTTVIASVRRRLPGGGYERLSTADIDFVDTTGPAILQHLGRRNAPVDPASTARLAAALLGHADHACHVISRWDPPRTPGCAPASVVHASGAWDRMRDAWAFALPRDLRQAGPSAILEAAGLPTDGPTSDDLVKATAPGARP